MNILKPVVFLLLEILSGLNSSQSFDAFDKKRNSNKDYSVTVADEMDVAEDQERIKFLFLFDIIPDKIKQKIKSILEYRALICKLLPMYVK